MRRDRFRNVMLTVLILVLAVGLVALMLYVKMREDAREEALKELSAQMQVQRGEEGLSEELQSPARSAEKMASDSFYQKLADGFDVNILIVGDSIGTGTGAAMANLNWISQLQVELMRQYKVNVEVNNLSMADGNTSYAGYARIMSLNDGVNYDLAILCYGQPDPVEGFSLSYESMIRAVMSKYPGCALLSVLESSQQGNDEKIQAIRTLAYAYGYPTVDTITPFAANYAGLTSDGVHPNDEGQRIYCDELLRVIAENVQANKGKEEKTVSPVNPDVTAFANFRYIAASEFQRLDDLSYSVPVNATGCLGVDYDPSRSEHKRVDIYADEVYIASLDNDGWQRQIVKVTDNCQVMAVLRIVFQTKEAADGFFGVCFSSAA